MPGALAGAMMAFRTVARVADLRPGTARVVEVGGRAVALVRAADGAFHAIDNACAHRGGPLGEGEVEGAVVTCPLHGWQYNATTGRCATNPAIALRTYPVRVEGDEVQVGL